MEHQFMLDEKMALLVTVEGKYVAIYFYNVNPETKEAFGRGFKLILPQYSMLGRSIKLIEKTFEHGGKCGVNLGYKMMVDSNGETMEFTNHFNGSKWTWTKEQFWRWSNSIHEIAPVITKEYDALALKSLNVSLKRKHNDDNKKTTTSATQTSFVNRLLIDYRDPDDDDSCIFSERIPGITVPWFLDDQVLKCEKLFVIICAEYAIYDIFNGSIFDCYCTYGAENQEHPCPGRQSIHNTTITPTVEHLHEKLESIIDCFNHIIGEFKDYAFQASKQMCHVFRSILYTELGRKAVKDTVARFIDESYHHEFNDANIIGKIRDYISTK